MIGTVQDITERKKDEEKIQNLANIVESSNDAIGTISLDNTLMSWNKGTDEVYGYSADEVIGKPVSILSPLNLADETTRLVELTKHGQKIQHYNTMRLRKDGKLIDVSLNLSPVFDTYGKLTGVSVISRDITESKIAEEKLRESEQKYRNIVETANEGILIIDDNAVVTYANKKMTDMLGYSLEEGLGRPIWNFLTEENKAIIKRKLEKRKQGINENYELKLIRQDDSSLWVLLNAKSIFDKDGKFRGTLSMLTDINEHKKTEEALAKIEIARKQEIHHRIKNNLQVICSLLDLQAEKFRGKRYIKDFEVIEAFAESHDRVTSMALIHEELHEGGGGNVVNFSIYLDKLVDNLFQTYKLGNKHIDLKMDLAENHVFDMDTAVPLGIIVNELVSNALKHAFVGRSKGEIRIKLQREEGGERINSFVLTVSDNGIGIPENINIEDLDSLGMQLVTSLVDQLDGELELKRNGGTDFVMRFKVIEKE